MMDIPKETAPGSWFQRYQSAVYAVAGILILGGVAGSVALYVSYGKLLAVDEEQHVETSEVVVKIQEDSAETVLQGPELSTFSPEEHLWVLDSSKPLLCEQNTAVDIVETFNPDKWARFFAKNENEIPRESFRQYFFDFTEPTKVRHESVVTSPSFDYGREVTDGSILPQTFGAFWIGSFTFATTTQKFITIDQSWASVRVLDNDVPIYKHSGSWSGTFAHTFPPGEHIVQVQYLNNWHTAEFSMQLTNKGIVSHDPPPSDPPDGPSFLFKGQVLAPGASTPATLMPVTPIPPDSPLWYASLYEATNPAQVVTVSLESSDRPVTLILGSYSPIRWRIEDTHNTPLRAVVVSSFAARSSVEGVPEATAVVHHVAKSIGTQTWLPAIVSLFPSCRATDPIFYCDGLRRGLTATLLIKEWFGRFVDGISAEYSAQSLRVPEYALNATTCRAIEDNKKRAISDWLKYHPTVDSLFLSTEEPVG